MNFAYYNREGQLALPPDSRGLTEAPLDSTVNGWLRQPVGHNNDLAEIVNPHGWTKHFTDTNLDRVRNGPSPSRTATAAAVSAPVTPLPT